MKVITTRTNKPRANFIVEFERDVDFNKETTLEFFNELRSNKAYIKYVATNFTSEKDGMKPITITRDGRVLLTDDIFFTTSEKCEYQILFYGPIKGLKSSNKFGGCSDVSVITDKTLMERDLSLAHTCEYRDANHQCFLISKMTLWERIKNVFKPIKPEWADDYLCNYNTVRRGKISKSTQEYIDLVNNS